MSRPRKSINIQRIASEAGVSISTVSRVLNNRMEVSDEVRRKVRLTLERNSFVAAPISSRRMNIGVVMPMEPTPAIDIYYTMLLEGMASYALANDTELTLVFHCEDTGCSLMDKLRSRGCHSAILFSSNKLKDHAKELSDSGMSIILINGRWSLPRIGYIDCDAFDAGLKMGAHLASLGHRNVILLQNILLDTHIAREGGVKKALEDVFGKGGFTLNCIPFIKSGQITDSGYLQACQALREFPKATAMVGINDQVSYGAIRACLKVGLRIPEDIAVAGFDDYPMSSCLVPALTTVKQPLFEMGRLAAEYASKSLCDVSAEPPPQVALPVELIVRESTVKECAR